MGDGLERLRAVKPTWRHLAFKYCWNHGWYHTDLGSHHASYGWLLRRIARWVDLAGFRL